MRDKAIISSLIIATLLPAVTHGSSKQKRETLNELIRLNCNIKDCSKILKRPNLASHKKKLEKILAQLLRGNYNQMKTLALLLEAVPCLKNTLFDRSIIHYSQPDNSVKIPSISALELALSNTAAPVELLKLFERASSLKSTENFIPLMQVIIKAHKTYIGNESTEEARMNWLLQQCPPKALPLVCETCLRQMILNKWDSSHFTNQASTLAVIAGMITNPQANAQAKETINRLLWANARRYFITTQRANTDRDASIEIALNFYLNFLTLLRLLTNKGASKSTWYTYVGSRSQILSTLNNSLIKATYLVGTNFTPDANKTKPDFCAMQLLLLTPFELFMKIAPLLPETNPAKQTWEEFHQCSWQIEPFSTKRVKMGLKERIGFIQRFYKNAFIDYKIKFNK